MMIVSYSFLAHSTSRANASSPSNSTGFGAIGPENDVKIWRIGMILEYPPAVFCPVRCCVRLINLLPESEAGYQHGFTDIGINK